jgi:vitamin B12/bleomycin/antimicrobial peptide transport system ATP-binding/permease protein
MNLWNRAMFDALEMRNSSNALFQAIVYVPLLGISVLVAVLTVYARMTIQRLWRVWFNRRLLDRWLLNNCYYQLNLVAGDHANPESRLADDLRIATEAPIDFGIGLASALLSAVTFMFVLWTAGGSISFNLAGAAITIPGFLVVAAVLYALLASGLMVFIGRRFVTALETKNQAEADYRYILTRLRENAESIALMGGQNAERCTLDQSFRTVVRRWRDISLQAIRTTAVSQTSGYFVPVLPILLCAPKFLEGSMTLGQVMQVASAFTVVQTALSWLVDNYPRFADWSASARRVASLMISIDMLEAAEKDNGAMRIRRVESKNVALRLCDLSVRLADATTVVKQADVTIAQGERILIVGQSGAGKSSLVRAISGQWPWGEGEVHVRRAATIFVVPQKQYIPLGTLRQAIVYPTFAQEVESDRVVQSLNDIGLKHLVDRLDEEHISWEHTLSAGEKQRLAFARLLIARPSIVVVDEAISALDLATQKELMWLIYKSLRNTTIIGVGDRPELEGFYDRKLGLQFCGDGVRLTRDIDLTRVAMLARERDRFRLARSGVPHTAAGTWRPEKVVESTSAAIQRSPDTASVRISCR